RNSTAACADVADDRGRWQRVGPVVETYPIAGDVEGPIAHVAIVRGRIIAKEVDLLHLPGIIRCSGGLHRVCRPEAVAGRESLANTPGGERCGQRVEDAALYPTPRTADAQDSINHVIAVRGEDREISTVWNRTLQSQKRQCANSHCRPTPLRLTAAAT